MKKSLKAILALAIVATMLVASIVTVSAAENVATGSSYTICRLSGGPGSEPEKDEDGNDAVYFYGASKNQGADLDYDRLTDGFVYFENYVAQESVIKSVMLLGTGKTQRFSFDLKGEKQIGSVVLYLYDTNRRAYNGKPAGNRGYQLDSFFHS